MARVPEARPPVIYENRYTLLDRILHRIAFRTGTGQRAAADVEELLFRDRLRSVRPGTPVFVTALPRSGTTILLNLLVETGRFATHAYRDMPFLLCPMLWRRLSRRFAVDDTMRERAHGDGLMVSGESPEAFEEMIWKHFWPEHYRDDRIVPWSAADADPEFDRFFERHMRKIVAEGTDHGRADRGSEGPTEGGPGRPEPGWGGLRYLSKNNLNIARLSAPPPPLRAGIVLVPFREPVQHAASMLRQHLRFLRIHREDDFVRRYMEAIGHHEFGRGLKPVDFGGWMADAPGPETLDFWLRYWIAAYREVLTRTEGRRVHLVSYGRVVAEPEAGLARLEEAIGLPASALSAHAGTIRPPRAHEAATAEVPPSVLEEAADLHEQLERVAGG